jgi:MFS family permease
VCCALARGAARGLRVPSRNALLADVVPADAYGRAYGFERAMDNLGAIIGPLLAIALVGLVGVRTAILLSIVPGLLAVAAMLYAIRHIAQPAERERRPLRLHVSPVLRDRLGRLLAGISVFELGNIAATLLILRATDLLEPGRGQDAAAQQAIALYVLYNLAATLVSVPAGHRGDRRGAVRVLAGGIACFALAYAGFAAASIALLALCFTPPASGSAASRPPNTPPSRPSRPNPCAARPSVSSPASRASPTLPPAPSPASSTPPCRRPPPSRTPPR